MFEKSVNDQKKILVMDDEPMILTLVTSMLELYDFCVKTAVEGKQAISLYQKAMDEGRPFDVVILDISIISGMGGVETVAELLKIDPDANCVVASGYCQDPVIINYMDYGFKGALAKPFALQQIMDVLGQIINNNNTRLSALQV